MELPAGNETVPLLMAFSLTRGIVTFAWEHQTVSGLKGVVDASFGPDGSSLFSLSNGLDNALALFSRLPLLDSTGAVVSDMQFKKSWTEADSNILGFAGAYEIEAGSFVSTGVAQGIQNITVKGGLKQHELICSAPPLYRDDSAGDALGSVLNMAGRAWEKGTMTPAWMVSSAIVFAVFAGVVALNLRAARKLRAEAKDLRRELD